VAAIKNKNRTKIVLGLYTLVAIAFIGLIGLGIGLGLGVLTNASNPNSVDPNILSTEITLTPTLVSVDLGMMTATIVSATPVIPTVTPTPTNTPTPTPLPPFEETFTYGYSIEGRPLQAYRLGTGESARFIIGAIHGGYEWNTVEVVSKTLEYFRENPNELPSNITLYLIPCANPDGYVAGRDAIVGRMNANGVDLNRNWAYQWQPMATHGTRPVNAGTAAFSEPETAILRDLLLEDPLFGRPADAVIFYHSAMGVVFSGAERSRSATFELTEAISAATGYRHQTEGVPGQITTGDAIDWLSTVGIAGTEIELMTRANISEEEWQRNLRGIQVFLAWQIPVIHSPDPITEAPPGYVSYTLVEGDILSVIAYDRCGITTEELLAVNQINDPNSIYPGDIILIPADCE